MIKSCHFEHKITRSVMACSKINSQNWHSNLGRICALRLGKSAIDTKKVMVFLFGSKVSGCHSSIADPNIGLLADENLPANLYHKIRNPIDESNIPWELDIIDFTRADQTFKKETLKDIIIWNI